MGFQIEMGPSGGIFVSSVNENSLAAQAGLVIGDQLLEVLSHCALLGQCNFPVKNIFDYPSKFPDSVCDVFG